MANGAVQANGIRNQGPQAPPVILHLLPINNTFERKTITVPFYPDVLRIGRQTNQKTIPTPLNGYFDSKVLSRQHAEIYADRDGRIFIRDVKSSNGTFLNGERLSPENRESDPREMLEGNVLELGIDIVSEDQKTVVHHKVSAKVEHAGFFGQTNDPLNFGDLDPSSGSGMASGPSQIRRNGSHGSMAGRGGLNAVMNQAANGVGAIAQQQHMRNWLNPISMEHIVKKLNAELKLADQQSKDLERARHAIDLMLSGKVDMSKEAKFGSEKEKARPSPTKSKTDLKAHFSEPPAPPPSAPLPEKPDVARALADPMIQPLLRRSETARPGSEMNSPTKADHSSDILKLCEELKLAKGELNLKSERMKSLEDELAQERHARESAEERARGLEKGERRDSPRDSYESDRSLTETQDNEDGGVPSLQLQLDRLRNTMDEMKQTMEAFRQRAETAEVERDEARQTLAEMVEQRRKDNAGRTSARSPSAKSTRSSSKHTSSQNALISSSTTNTIKASAEPNGHTIAPAPFSPTSDVLLERAGVEEGQPITPEQAKILTQFLTQEVLRSGRKGESGERVYHAREIASALAVVIAGVVAMTWLNGWSKVDR